MHSAFLLSALAGLTTGLPTLDRRQFSSTANDVTDGICKGTTLIFARGTTETGNMGSVVGPTLANDLSSSLGGDLAVQGVDYPASVDGAVTGATSPASAEGATTMANLAKQALSQCSTTKVVLSGYSQGAEQVHGALMNLAGTTISSAVTFGDPLQKQAFENIDASKVKVFCASGDGVCAGTFVISAAHLSYGTTDAQPAAQFIAGAIGA